MTTTTVMLALPLRGPAKFAAPLSILATTGTAVFGPAIVAWNHAPDQFYLALAHSLLFALLLFLSLGAFSSVTYVTDELQFHIQVDKIHERAARRFLLFVRGWVGLSLAVMYLGSILLVTIIVMAITILRGRGQEAALSAGTFMFIGCLFLAAASLLIRNPDDLPRQPRSV